jgi:hypothetical protein
MCKNCGQAIQDLDFDNGMEFDDEGRPMAGRGQIVDMDAIEEENINLALGGPADSGEVKKFTDTLTETQKLIYDTTKEIFQQVGIYADIQDYRRVIERVESEIQKQPSREEYGMQMKRRAAAGIKDKPIDYDVLINRVLVISSGVHVFIEIQTHIPDYVPRYTIPGCRASFTGFPLGSDKDFSGMEYIACAVAGININRAPWNLTGFMTVASEKKRQEFIFASIKKMLTDILKTAAVQHLITSKKSYLERIYGAVVLEDRIPELIPPGFKPTPYAVSIEDSTKAIVVPEAATSAEIIRGWIQSGHRLARQNGVYVKGSPFSETSCCYTEVTQPKGFWSGTAASAMLPVLPKKRAPMGQANSQTFVHFKPRSLAKLLADPPEELFYRVFLRVCYEGPNMGLPHEPGYTNVCSKCGFVFADNPYIEMPAPPLAADKKLGEEMMGEWRKEMEAIVMKGKVQLDTQKVAVTKETFQQLLDATHKRYRVERKEPVKPAVGMVLLAKLYNIEPEPFLGWRIILSDTIKRLNELPPDADNISIAEVYGPMSYKIDELYTDFQKRLSMNIVTTLKKVMQEQPAQIVESIRSYILMPFTRLLLGFNIKSHFVQPAYELPPITKTDIMKEISGHMEFMTQIMKHVKGYTKMKMQQVVNQLSVILPIIQNEIRAQLVPGGVIAVPYIIEFMILGVLGEFINPNVIPEWAKRTGEVGTIDPSARMPLNILDACLSRLRTEGLDFTDEQIRDIIAQREEDEALTFIHQNDMMTPEEKKIAMTIKRLGLKEWSIGGTKAVYTLNPELLEREKARREQMGIQDFVDTTQMSTVFAEDIYGGGGEVGGEAGYDNAQYGMDDF